jgi:hypothetical protein
MSALTKPPLWSSGQSSWIQIRRPGFDSRHYRIIWKKKERKKKTAVGLERGPLSLVSTTEELLGRNSSCSGLESRVYCRRDPSRWPRGTLYPHKLAIISPTSGGRSVGIVRSRTQAMEFIYFMSAHYATACHLPYRPPRRVTRIRIYIAINNAHYPNSRSTEEFMK